MMKNLVLVKSLVLVLLVFAELMDALPNAGKNAICSSKPAADVVFVLDSSGSIWEINFRRQIQFVINVISQFPIGRDSTQVGVVSFSNWAQPEFYLRDFEDQAQIEAALWQMVQMKGDTNTAAALAYVRDVMLTSEYGMRAEVPHIVIVLTDGKSNDPKQTALQAELAKRRGDIHLFAIGVGNEVDREELKNIASEPTDQYIFTVKSYAALETIKDLLAIKTCEVTNPPLTFAPTADPSVQVDQACGIGVTADILFAGSPLANDIDTVTTMKFFKDVASQLDIGKDKVHVGLVPKNCDRIPELNLQNYEKKSLRQLAKRSVPSTESVLRYMNDIGFSQRHGGRQNVKKIGLVIVGEPLDSTKEVLREAIRAKQHKDVEMFVIGVGKGISPGDLKAIASKPEDNHVFHVTDYDELPSIVDKVSAAMCPVSLL